MLQFRELLRLHHTTDSTIREIAANCRVSKSTVSRDLFPARVAGTRSKRWAYPGGRLVDRGLGGFSHSDSPGFPAFQPGVLVEPAWLALNPPPPAAYIHHPLRRSGGI